MIELKPFAPHGGKISLRGDLRLISQRELEISFFLLDPDQIIELPQKTAPEASPVRAHNLWQRTCYEAFFSSPGENSYFEVNLSPSGEWNLYHFQKYRDPQPPRETTEFSLLEINGGSRSMHAVLQSNSTLATLDCSLCAVLMTSDQTFYYSTNHAGEKPDFHRRDSFTLKRDAR